MEYEHVASFGELLKAFRKQKHIGQQQVAEQLAIHRNTVGAWERGDRLPDTRGTVLELAKCLQLDEQETACLLEASLTGIATRWNVPYRRNPFFTGREELLQRLHMLLRQEKATALTQSLALSGLGGIGKTQLAIEYAYRYAQQYASVFWFNADTTESILSSYTAIAVLLDLPEQQEPDQQKVVVAVNRWLSTHRDWLLIVDNVEERELVASMLPTSPEGSLLFTTRRQTLGTLAYPLEVDRMSQEDGTRFLLHRSRRLSLDEPLDHCSFAEVMEASRIVEAMEGLPLALDQAGAYIEETQGSLQDYLQLFQSHRTILLGQRGGEGSDHPDSVATTLALSIASIAQQHPAAVDLLKVCALLHPDGIPEELFLEAGSLLGPTLAATCADVLSWNKLLASASAYSLLKRQPKEKMLSMHRLVQAVLQDGMEEAERGMWMERIIAALHAVFPEERHTTWKRCERLLPHVLICEGQTHSRQQANLEQASVLFKAAMYFFDRMQLVEAEPLYWCVVHIREQILGFEHCDVATPLHALAVLYTQQGKYDKAEPLYQRALHLREQIVGTEHPDVALTLAGLSMLYQEQGKYEEAEPLLQRALYICEQKFGAEHPHLAGLYNNLANIYLRQKKYVEAEPLYQRALHMWEQSLGTEHPHVSYPLGNLAEAYQEQGRYAEAEYLYKRALDIRERSQGPEHLLMADLLNGLATLYRKQGKYEEAEPLFLRALALREELLGSQHPDTADVLHGFAAFRRAQGRAEEAAPSYQRALSIRERVFGPNHPLTKETRENYIALLREMGRQEEAGALEAGLSEE